MTVVATAGHVDHGKSSLVRRLTGTDPDRWDEEKRRGLTIDLGFAAVTLPSGRRIEFVDVPGHSRYLANMLAGAGAVRAALLVVSALEGWKEQSAEHYAILNLLGIDTGAVVLTHADSVSPETIRAVTDDVRERVAGSAFGSTDPVVVDSMTGRGFDRLRETLDDVASRLGEQTDDRRPRLWIDRAFTARGAGTVVTGTLGGGTLHVGDVVVTEPGGREARIRALQTHFESIETVGPGHRVAVNLAGVDRREVRRGLALVTPHRWLAARSADVSMTVLPDGPRPLEGRGAFVMYTGTADVPVRVRVLHGQAIAPGASGRARLHFAESLPLVPGDRFVLRSVGDSRTIGGGEVLVIDSPTPASRIRAEDDLGTIDHALTTFGPMSVADLEQRTGRRRDAVVGDLVMTEMQRAARLEQLRERLSEAAEDGVLTAELDDIDRALLEVLAADGVAHRSGARWTTSPTEPPSRPSHPWLAAAHSELFCPPATDSVDRADLVVLRRDGWAIELDGIWFATRALSEAAARLAEMMPDDTTDIAVGDIRRHWGTTRKFALPLLGWLDANGGTRRRDGGRRRGPRLNQIAAGDLRLR